MNSKQFHISNLNPNIMRCHGEIPAVDFTSQLCTPGYEIQLSDQN